MSKKQISKTIAASMRELGFAPVFGHTFGAFLHFFKRAEAGLVLNLGVQASRLFEETFTGAFYLGPTFTWGYMPPDFPQAAYARVGRFLELTDRARLLSREWRDPGVQDAWWSPFSESSAGRFCEAIALAESRFLNQPGLVESVLSSVTMKRHLELVEKTIELASHGPVDIESAKVALQVLNANAAEALRLVESQQKAAHYIRFLGQDAYRCLLHRVKKVALSGSQ
jgi:hypothetical protein